MAFPTNEKPTLSDRWSRVRSCATRIRDRTEYLISQPLNRVDMLQHKQILAENVKQLETLLAGNESNGLLEHARREEGDSRLDLTVEFNTLKSTAVALVQWIVDHAAKSADGKYEVFQDESADPLSTFVNVPLDQASSDAFKAEVAKMLPSVKADAVVSDVRVASVAKVTATKK